ncbi:MAG: ABC transporter permease subunit, partial [Comamonadaceae bacterium]
MFILAPLVVAVLSSLTTTSYLKFPPDGITFKWYSAALDNLTFVNSFLISIQLAVLTMIIAVGLGVLAAYAIATRPSPFTSFLEQLFLSPLMLPAVVFGVGFLFALSAAGYRGTFVGGLLAHVIVAGPFVIRSTLAGFRTRDPRIEEASRSLGAGPIRT